MLKLIKLELVKNKFGWYIKSAIIANILMTAILCFIMYITQKEGDLIVTTHQDAFILIGAMVRATFIVFAAVLIAKIVIEEYKNKTILIMFSYPVNRKKMIASKLLITSALTFITMLLTNIIVGGLFTIINDYYHFVPFSITASQYFTEVFKMIPYSMASTGISLIPLYFGMRKFSVPTTIFSSLLVVMIACSTNPVFSMVTIIPFQLGLAVIGVMNAYLAIRNIEKEDVI
ncbi:ABC transporter permease [Viridibacillus sp. NPDC096237]|uniref:ABC transporter permease n=1 Tax=Viridibacillus sp. NPDC096237 TaxID=3390721 RepID=UPI003CFCF4E3